MTTNTDRIIEIAGCIKQLENELAVRKTELEDILKGHTTKFVKVTRVSHKKKYKRSGWAKRRFQKAMKKRWEVMTPGKRADWVRAIQGGRKRKTAQQI